MTGQALRHASSRWAQITLIWLVVTAVLGTFLRLYPFYPTGGIAYPNLTHAHSHVAFLGWIFNAFYLLITIHYLADSTNIRYYKRLFTWMQVAVAGMLLFFPLYGYNALTIAISTVHTVLTVLFALRFYRTSNPDRHASLSSMAIKIALFFMLLSAAGPLTLGPLSAMGYKGTVWYNLAIYFYLHFQYNGWFFFALIGVIFLFLEKHPGLFNRRSASVFIWVNAAAVIPAYALSALWINPPAWVYATALAGTGIQLFSLIYLIQILRPYLPVLPSLFPSAWVRLLLVITFVSLAVRNILQFAGSFPDLATLAAGNRFVVIAFLHLNFLGMLTPFLMAIFMHSGWVAGKRVTYGLILFLAGFISSELILFLSPVFIAPHPQALLLFLAILTAAGISIWASAWKKYG